MKTRIAIALSFLFVLAAPLANAQSQKVLGSVNVPFKFMAAKKEMPAGNYELVRTEPEGKETRLLLRSVEGKSAILIHVIERLAETSASEKHGARVVFDTVGEQRFLSEFWPADVSDGYLLGVTKGEQKHEVVESK